MNQDDRLGPYRLLRRLGEGGMGVVHLAVDPQGRQVAVKVLRSEVAGDDVARRRLSREVETMRRVRSRYIAEVLDADVTGHRPYIVTRYVPGRPLDEIIKQDGPFDLPALIRVAHGVASALAAVHAVGVIHRDLKPGNVLILDGDPVLIDFGIAQAVDATRLTQTGMFIGTPGYLAPEIIEGHEAGPEVDVHAWAGTLLFGATGQPPFGKGTLEMIFYNITAGKADVASAPKELQPLLKAAFQRNPAKRPNAADLAEQTARLLPSLPGRPEEISTVPRADRSAPHPLPDPADVPTPAIPPARPSAPHAVPGPYGSASHPSAPPAATPHAVGPPAATPHAAAPPSTQQGSGQYGRPPSGEFVSLLGQEGQQQGGDPWPTRRVSPEELRQIREEAGAAATPWDVPTNIAPDPRSSRPWPYPTQPPHSGQAPAQPPAGSAHAGAFGAAARPGGPAQQGYPPSGDQVTPQRREADMPTRRVRPDTQGHPSYQQSQPPQPPFQPAPEPSTKREPYIPGARPGLALQRSKAYGVAGAMLLIIMTALAVLAPVVMAAVAIPFAILLRAADLAQPQLNARRSTGAAALDVVRVFALPGALVKSAGVTLALVLYALILGLPVTLLLIVLVKGMPTANALAWGAAVSLLTICAGPGVEGPGRQMRRSLSSLMPSRTVAMVVAGVLGVVAALTLAVAIGTHSVWSPVSVVPVENMLDDLLRGKAGR